MAEQKPMDAAAFALWIGEAEHGVEAHVNGSRMCWISAYDDENECFWVSFGDGAMPPDYTVSFRTAAEVAAYLKVENIGFDGFEEQNAEHPDDLIEYRVRVSGPLLHNLYPHVFSWDLVDVEEDDITLMQAIVERRNSTTFEQSMDQDDAVVSYRVIA